VTTCDGFILLAVGTDAQYEKLVRTLRDESLAGRISWSTNDVRVRERDELRTELNRIFSTRSTNEWLDLLSTSGVPHAPILDVAVPSRRNRSRRGLPRHDVESTWRPHDHAHTVGRGRTATTRSSRSARARRRHRRHIRYLTSGRREWSSVKGVNGREVSNGVSAQLRHLLLRWPSATIAATI